MIVGVDLLMSLKRLQTFIEVVDRKSFSEAAIQLNLTQSAVSKQIKNLEQELGVHLLRRDQVNLAVTEAGSLAYLSGKRMIAEWSALLKACATFENKLTGVLRIGASTIPGTYLLPPIIKEFRDRYPHIDITINVDSSENVVKRLSQGYYDVAVVGLSPTLEHFHSEFLTEDQLVLIAPLTVDRTIADVELSGISMIGRESGSGTQMAVEEALWSQFGLHHYDLHYVAHVVDTVTMIAMVEAGVGWGFVSSYAVTRANVRTMMQLDKRRGFYMTYAEKGGSDPLVEAFTTLVMERFTKK